MKDESQEAIFLKHYQNIHRLTGNQLAAIEKGDMARLHDLVAQKQMIIDHLRSNETESVSASFQQETVKKIEKLLTDINAMEDKSQELLKQRQDNVRFKLATFQQAKIIRQAYEAPISKGNVVNRVK